MNDTASVKLNSPLCKSELQALTATRFKENCIESNLRTSEKLTLFKYTQHISESGLKAISEVQRPKTEMNSLIFTDTEYLFVMAIKPNI